MEYLEYTNIGNRQQNQDFILSQNMGENKALFVVADGMGGYANGGLAAKTVAETLCSSMVAGFSIPDGVNRANKVLNQIIWETGSEKMGCCLAGVLVDGFNGKLFWVGDCRVYVYRSGELLYVTEDHSLVAQLEKHKKLTIAQREHYGHIVSRSIMGSPDDTVDVIDFQFDSGDEVVICSDGLHKTLPIEVLLDMIHSKTLALESRNDDFDDNHSFIYIKL